MISRFSYSFSRITSTDRDAQGEPESVEAFLKLLHPKLTAQFELARKVKHGGPGTLHDWASLAGIKGLVELGQIYHLSDVTTSYIFRTLETSQRIHNLELTIFQSPHLPVSSLTGLLTLLPSNSTENTASFRTGRARGCDPRNFDART